MKLENKVFKTKGEALSNAIAMNLIDFEVITDRDNTGKIVYRIDLIQNDFSINSYNFEYL
ncbi:MAG TPA: hypothetical protein PLK24_09155 [Atribacter sp.]|jgi:hypothetical protein|uniref:Uncharacterized protein n=1 Tax=Candidatus Atribacter allofermentans TaxID=1852833 RepID=A0A1V5SVK6_9BACT|nr:hypothetical protein [Atribacter sp.]MDD3714706.1 hypothetical protein [Atribacterota bacterium]OQA58557.1 MAG: hypothetical protein BWY41_01032 [Candidatus Atribacteria bacterium ADurb.Bin276]HHT10371.1 hypothetical protein [Candidatus Atribacteria bacterium]MDI9594521.1 hypothetical protein [Atribacterota bacterium]HQK84091.1 hypothetical protein [Atribacter sp.]